MKKVTVLILTLAILLVCTAALSESENEIWTVSHDTTLYNTPPGTIGSKIYCHLSAGNEATLLGPTSGEYTMVKAAGLTGYVKTCDITPHVNPLKDSPFEIGAPARAYDFDKYLSLLDEFYAEHPGVMGDELYASLLALGERGKELAKLFRREEDPFEQTLKLIPVSLQEAGENEQIFPFVENSVAYYSLVTISPKRWLKAEKAIFLSDADDRVSESLYPKEERITGYTSNGDRMETYTVSFGYNTGDWEELLSNTAMTSVRVRYYGDSDRTYDYTLTEDEIKAIHDVLSITVIPKQITSALYEWSISMTKEWLESLQTVDE